TLDEARLQKLITGKLKGVPNAEDVYGKWMAQMDLEVIPVRRVAQGHDLFRSLSLFVKTKWGVSQRGDVWEKFARSHWRLSDLIDTDLYRQVKEWSLVNSCAVWRSAS
ncbi:hypothetical protein ACIRST_29335, partial [Kitasatospora sp. NPDC101447]|uniref:hypothetical protein n=1 Tax=Kitasatospora sp. NPDC101447 TaxID=3364102 RepID=UPI0038064179